MGYPHFSNDCDEYHCLVRCFGGPENTETITFIGAFEGETGTEHVHARPEIVVLCGSTRFYDEFQEANYHHTMAGRIVLSVGFYPHSKIMAGGHGEGVGHDSAEKVSLDELHKRKIDLADWVYVVSDATGYFGDSTRSEIDYAVRANKPVLFQHDTARLRWGQTP